MSYQLDPGKMYRMPTHFGPSLGPRQGPGDRKFSCLDSPLTTTVTVSFLSARKQLERLLPEGFRVAAEPLVSVAASYITDIEWLAGRGYNTLGVRVAATFSGRRDRAAGDFLLVLWENLADPIITGREELGFSKLYCELPEPRRTPDGLHCTAAWMGFTFAELSFCQEANDPQAPSTATKPAEEGVLTGTMHYKYMPRTGEWGAADAAYPVLTPAARPNQVVEASWSGTGSVQFHRARWEDLPTLYTIVNTLEELEIREYRGAGLVKTVGGKDLSDQRILR